MTINHFPRRTFIKSSLAFTLAALLPLKKFSMQTHIASDQGRAELKRLLQTYGPEFGSLPQHSKGETNGHI